MKKNNFRNGFGLILTILLFGAVATVQAAPGDIDATFAQGGKTRWGFGGGSDEVKAVAVQTDGKLIAVGSSSSGALVARYNTDGSLDASFWAGGRTFEAFSSQGIVTAVKVQSDGKIVVAGSSQGDFAVTRFNGDGSLDISFGTGGRVITPVGVSGDEPTAMTIQTDGKLIVAGGSYVEGSYGNFALVRYNANGSLDTTFDADGKVRHE